MTVVPPPLYASQKRRLIIGSRQSPLAMAQAAEVRRRLLQVNPDGVVDIVGINTTGDRLLDRKLADIGGKGLFSKELDQALAEGRIDIAVHSMKDMETLLPEGQAIAAVLPREDPRDVLVCEVAGGLDELPANARVGTASLRRAAQILHRRPDIMISTFRGNVATRLKKLEQGQADATLLAQAGLNRLNLRDPRFHLLDVEVMLPAAAQGAIAIVMRAAETKQPHADWLRALDDADSRICVTAERAVLRTLDGSCRTPIAALATPNGNGDIRLRALAASPDGRVLHRVQRSGPAAEADRLGAEAGRELRSLIGTAFL